MTIRPAIIKDKDSIKKLNTAIMEEINQTCDDDLVPKFAETQAGDEYFLNALIRTDGCFFVAEENGELIGYVNGNAKDVPYRKSKYFEIENLGVIPRKARLGIGSKLLDAITKWAKDHGYQKIYIESYIKNTNAVSFYKNNKFKEIDICLEKTVND